MDTISKEDFISLLGEGFHTAFRKIPVKHANAIRTLISDMPNEDWLAVLEFVCACFRLPIKIEKEKTITEYCSECGSKIIIRKYVHMHKGLCADCSRKYK